MTDQNAALQHCRWLIRDELMETQPEVASVGKLPGQCLSVSPELSAHICCLRPELLLEAPSLE